MIAIQQQIEARLAQAEPNVEVLLAEVVSGDTVRLFIDHPQGVTLGLCERVSGHLNSLREEYALEVSSPGAERPLTKPDHFRRFVGRRARIRTREPIDERRTFTGEIVGATDTEVTLGAAGGVVAVAYDGIQRSNLLGD